ncbi:MAG: hypothetical protein IT456_14415, partial [Planctomycetes bacterium]|nr:hypothetical protein [Planctomycetota bacterium]
ELRVLPEQVVQQGQATLSVMTQGVPKPFLLYLGDTAGPTNSPGLPTVLVGGTYFTAAGWTDAAGSFNLPFTVPPVASALGRIWYSQVLTVDAAYTSLATSNLCISLFTQVP